MNASVAIVGTGPTGLYVLAGLLESPRPLSITMFEQGSVAGLGMPYSPETANRAMLANVAIVEVPALTQSYLDWLHACAPEALTRYGLSHDRLQAYSFTPRLLLGDYFRAQLLSLIQGAQEKGHQVEVIEGTRVTDVQMTAQRVSLSSDQGTIEPSFDRVVLATGHEFDSVDPVQRGYFPHPWSGLIDAQIGEVAVGVMGTSLSAIDSVMAVAQQHGCFQHGPEGTLVFASDAQNLQITMMSRHGLLPEAAFYYPVPYEPLCVMTDERLAQFERDGGGLDDLFECFCLELSTADAAYARHLELETASADDFAERYFQDRQTQDPFTWARRRLAEVEANTARKITVPWRYAILRMHEKVEDVLHVLSDEDRGRFDRSLKRVFVDNYSAIPPESIRRLLALHDAGVLKVAALGEDYDLNVAEGITTVVGGEFNGEFEIFIDARGQKALSTEDLPFPSLRSALMEAGQEYPEVNDEYALVALPELAGRIFFGAIPYLLHDRPFVQGLVESAEIGSAIAQGVIDDTRRPQQPRSRHRTHALAEQRRNW